MNKPIPNINVIRSTWRRIKSDIKDAIIRDLKPVKHVKGGGGAAPPPRGPAGPGGWAVFRRESPPFPRTHARETVRETGAIASACRGRGARRTGVKARPR